MIISHFRYHSWFRFGFGSVSVWFRLGVSLVSVRFLVCHLPIPRVVCYFVPSILPQLELHLAPGSGGDFWCGQRRCRLRLAPVLVATPALVGVNLGYVRLWFPSHLGYSSPRFRFPIHINSQSAGATPSRPTPSVPSRSIPFHPVPSRSVRSHPKGLGLVMVMFHFDLTRGLGLVLVRFWFGLVLFWFGSYSVRLRSDPSRFCSPFHPISGRPPYSVPSHPTSSVPFHPIGLSLVAFTISVSVSNLVSGVVRFLVPEPGDGASQTWVAVTCLLGYATLRHRRGATRR